MHSITSHAGFSAVFPAFVLLIVNMLKRQTIENDFCFVFFAFPLIPSAHTSSPSSPLRLSHTFNQSKSEQQLNS